MGNCKNDNCDALVCDGNCKDRAMVRARQREREQCDAWRCQDCKCGNWGDRCRTCSKPRALGECVKFGPHFNAQVVDSDLSPADGQAVMDYYENETVALPLAVVWVAWPGRPGVFFLAIGNLKLSHQFCLLGVTGLFGTIPGGLPLPVTPLRFGVAGEEIACDNGSWPHVIDRPKFNTPAIPAAVRPNCVEPCPPPPCACTPARGNEFFIVEVDPLITVLAGGTLYITRCDWMAVKNNCIDPVSGRVRFPFELPSRVVVGAVLGF